MQNIVRGILLWKIVGTNKSFNEFRFKHRHLMFIMSYNNTIKGSNFSTDMKQHCKGDGEGTIISSEYAK
jgi:hypothetical protein